MRLNHKRLRHPDGTLYTLGYDKDNVLQVIYKRKSGITGLVNKSIWHRKSYNGKLSVRAKIILDALKVTLNAL